MQSPAVKRFVGTLVGVLSSLGAVILWILLGMFGFIAGYVGALMGLLFLFPYKKLNPEDKSLYPYIFAAVLIVIEIAGAEMLSILLYSILYYGSFAEAFYSELMFFFIDIGLGLIFSFIVYAVYVPKFRRRDRQNNMHSTQQNYYGNMRSNNYDPFAGNYNDPYNPPNYNQPKDDDPFGDDPFGHNDK